MELGALFPTRELPVDADVIREWTHHVVESGFSYIVVPDHVFGVDPAHHPEWAAQWPHSAGVRAPYTAEHVFHDPLVLFGFFAAICDLELATGILVLPQRQTAVVAKQAAEVDVLCKGRLRLSVGIGWNPVEYEALGVAFHDRGARIEEQIEVMRLLWTSPVVEFEGRFHHLVGVGVSPLPVQRPIPVWLGGESSRVLERIGRLGDGWSTGSKAHPGEEFASKVGLIRRAAREAGRDGDEIGVEVRLWVGDRSRQELKQLLSDWTRVGPTGVIVDTMNAGRATLDEHAEALQRVADAWR